MFGDEAGRRNFRHLSMLAEAYSELVIATILRPVGDGARNVLLGIDAGKQWRLLQFGQVGSASV